MRKIDRRGFFATVFAVVAGWFTAKPSLEKMLAGPSRSSGWIDNALKVNGPHDEAYMTVRLWPQPTVPPVMFFDANGTIWECGAMSQRIVRSFDGKHEMYEFYYGAHPSGRPWTREDHGVHFFNRGQFGIRLPQFDKHALTLTSEPLTKEQTDVAFDEVNAMMDRWADEPWPEYKVYVAPPKVVPHAPFTTLPSGNIEHRAFLQS